MINPKLEGLQFPDCILGESVGLLSCWQVGVCSLSMLDKFIKVLDGKGSKVLDSSKALGGEVILGAIIKAQTSEAGTKCNCMSHCQNFGRVLLVFLVTEVQSN